MIKGFSIIKFIAGCAMTSLITYAVYLFISSWDEQTSVRRVISILIILVSSVIMWYLQLPKLMLHFVLGVTRYNKLRILGYSTKKIHEISQNKRIPEKDDRKIAKKQLKLQNKVMKLKRIHSLQQQLPHQIYKKISMQPQSMLTQKDLLQQKSLILENQKNIEKVALKQMYQQFVKKFTGKQVTELKFQNEKTIRKCNEIIGQIFQKQSKKQEQNISQLVFHLQSVYNIKIIDYKGNKNNQNKQSSKNKKLMTDKFQFTIDEILSNYEEHSLKFGYQLKNRSQQIHEKSQNLGKIDKIEKAIKQRRRLDRCLNFGSQFVKNTTRLQMIQRLKQIAENGKKNEKIIPDFESIDQSYEYIQFVVWVLSKHINQLVKNKIDEASINYNVVKGQYCFCLKLQPLKHIIHYNIFHNQRPPNQSKYYRCNPENNIVSLLYTYLFMLNRFDHLRNQLPQVPQLYSYVYDVCYNK